ncbi:MAG: 3-dehydroquinate synthase [bacterium]|nr:3-dehydroquinate synthase [bacterium]
MEIVRVNLGSRGYDIKIGRGILREIDFKQFGRTKYGIITDSNIKKLYGEKLQNIFIEQGLKMELFDFPAGEKSKNWEVAGSIGRELVKKDLDKGSLIIAVGGGVVGDLAGFVASIYKRGIGYVQIPTTLLAQVDSSIGGKTGVDVPQGKNLFGTFYQPKAVFADIDFLKTLPEEEIKNGLAEVIKYGMIRDAELFRYLEENYSSRTDDFYLSIIKRCCQIKAKIVEQDEKEEELRKILNYGHTVGHAIESAQGYKISHGRAVALGMICEGKISNEIELLNDEDLNRQNQLIKNIGLPTAYKGQLDDLIDIMKKDKKAKSGEIHFVFPVKIGEVKRENDQIAFPVDTSFIRKCLSGLAI